MASTRVVRAHSRHQASSDWNTGMAVLGNPGLEGGGRAGMLGSAGEMAELGNPGLRRRRQ